LIERVLLRGKERAALVDGGFHNWIVVVRKRNLRPAGLDEVLIDMEAMPEGLQGRLQTLDGVILIIMVKTLVVDTLDSQHHSQVAGLGEECPFVPEAIQVDVVIQRCGFLPRL